MPMTINVGLSKKVGLPDYGSVGATCSVTLEADHVLLDNDLERFHERVNRAFAACRQAVEDELLRHQGAGTCASGSPNGHARPEAPVQSGNNAPSRSNGNGAARNGNGSSTATEKQLGYARQLAKQISGLGIRRLEDLAQKMYGRPLVALTTFDASGLIDTLKEIKAGQIDLATVLGGSAP